MEGITFTVQGVLAATKFPLGRTPTKVSLRLHVGDDHTHTTADIPVPDEALEAIYRHTRDVAPRRALTHGDGAAVTVTVTIEAD